MPRHAGTEATVTFVIISAAVGSSTSGAGARAGLTRTPLAVAGQVAITEVAT